MMEKRLVSFCARCLECSFYRAATTEVALKAVQKATDRHSLKFGHQIEIDATYRTAADREPRTP
jgi:hypothetical protein